MLEDVHEIVHELWDLGIITTLWTQLGENIGDVHEVMQ